MIVTKDYRGEDVIKIVDFGLAKLIDEKGVEKLTQRGVVFGTPQYMSPEQATGDKLDERTDLYAAGLIFYEMLAGQGPFDTSDIGRLLQMQLTTPPPSLPDSVPRPLAKVVEKLLEKSMSNRYASAREVIAALDEAEKSGPPTLPYAVSYVPTRTGAHLGRRAAGDGAARIASVRHHGDERIVDGAAADGADRHDGGDRAASSATSSTRVADLGDRRRGDLARAHGHRDRLIVLGGR